MAIGVEKSPEAFRTISEVSDELGVPAHVLRFWESRFTQIKPVKRAGGRRYYRPEDLVLIAVLRGAVVFMGDLMRAIDTDLRWKLVIALSALGGIDEAGIGQVHHRQLLFQRQRLAGQLAARQ